MNSGKIQHNKFAQLVAGLITCYVLIQMWQAGVFDRFFEEPDPDEYSNVGLIWMVLSYVVAGIQVVGYLALAAIANITVFAWDLFKFVRGTDFSQWSAKLPKFNIGPLPAQGDAALEQWNDPVEEEPERELDPELVERTVTENREQIILMNGVVSKLTDRVKMLERERDLERYHEANTTKIVAEPADDSGIPGVTTTSVGINQGEVAIKSSVDWNHPVSRVSELSTEEPDGS